MKIRPVCLFFIFILIWSHARPSTSVIIGKDASASGAVLFGHNEDNDGRRIVNVWHVERRQHASGDSVQLISGVTIPQVKETWAYLWFQMNGLAYSDIYMNEWAVTVASNACPSKLDSTITSGKIGYDLRRLIVERVQSAKEGIRIAGQFLDSLGYDDYGRTLLICDPNEAWLLCMPGGRYWVAQRVPDDGIVVLPNQFILGNIDFKEGKNRLFSREDIRQLAIDQGWYNPVNNIDFNFAAVFGKADTSDLRQWRGQQILKGNKISNIKKSGETLPWMITSKKKVKLMDVMTLLRDHFEGTVYAEQSEACKGCDYCHSDFGACMMNPNRMKYRSICTGSTQYAIVAELRNWLPWPAGGVLWVSFGRPDCHPFLPWYATVDSIPGVYHNTPGIQDWKSALTHHFDPVPGTFDYDPRCAYWIQNELENTVDLNYSKNMDFIIPIRNAVESRLIEFQPTFEASMLRLWKKSPKEASEYCCELIVSATDETLQKSIQLIRKLKGLNFK